MTAAPERPDDLVELVRQAQAGSNDAAQLLFIRCRDPLLAVIRSRITPPLRRLYDSDDFLASTFAEIFTRHFTSEVLQSPTSLWPYLKKIAENKVYDAARKYLATRRFNIRCEVPLNLANAEEELWSTKSSPVDALLLKELVEERLVELIEQLPLMLQDVIHLLLQGNNGPQIARILKVEPKRVYRAMAWLKKKIVE